MLMVVSVAGCLGYDVLAGMVKRVTIGLKVSVAGCLGYDVLVYNLNNQQLKHCYLYSII
jgi:uncharacterized OsmC-like protein